MGGRHGVEWHYLSTEAPVQVVEVCRRLVAVLAAESGISRIAVPCPGIELESEAMKELPAVVLRGAALASRYRGMVHGRRMMSG